MWTMWQEKTHCKPRSKSQCIGIIIIVRGVVNTVYETICFGLAQAEVVDRLVHHRAQFEACGEAFPDDDVVACEGLTIQ